MPDGNTLEIIENINKLYPKLSILIHSMQPIEVYGKILKKYKINSKLEFYVTSLTNSNFLIRTIKINTLDLAHNDRVYVNHSSKIEQSTKKIK